MAASAMATCKRKPCQHGLLCKTHAFHNVNLYILKMRPLQEVLPADDLTQRPIAFGVGISTYVDSTRPICYE